MSYQIRGAVLSLSLILGACAHAPRPLSDSDAAAVREEVQQMLNNFQRYSATQQWDSLVSLYVDDGRFRWIENGVVRYRSPAMIRSALSSLQAGTRFQTNYRDTEITPITPGVASLATLFETRFGDSASPNSFTFGGAITMTLIRHNGAWRILEGHTSSPIPRGR